MADDLGMLDIGTFGSEIRISTIDGLAKAGVIAEDLWEVNDLSSREPEKLAEMIALWEQYAEQHGVVLPAGE